MLSVLTFKWKPSRGYRSEFGPETVNVLRRMVERHYPDQHRFVCITDDTEGLDPEVETFPLWTDYSDVQNPHGAYQPSCYRRLKLFSVQAGEWFGDRFVCIDLDTVLVNSVRKLWNRPEDFVIWGSKTDRRSWYNGSMFMLTAGARKQVWEQFDPIESPRLSKQAGRFGSDQGWISYLLGPGEAQWGTRDGVYSYRVHLKHKRKLPENAKAVFFHGHVDPWSPRAQQLEWVKRHYN